ncbi:MULTISPECIES: signal recognition particle-docking protein FtsY [Marinobacter]|jgi:fused signal recognition particle receptor|uniref:Signal recognition particle receptor FtsY n=1 Tax=Marinobacter nauticus TaxID=2743 RepID=A0A833JL34_MARNT|nr:signal recognition particle-docking protein FtsY [Marinobacter nauticus]MEC8898903.1 signal recognition particle-docking protein FtsY [Pseudomonadota bacterium]KAE8543837.1 Signal recognition particle receptor FtsY [Marinobacter nauticus]MBY5937534.1 signal recognition particle-docking protein FtsY [Marinobacter nauticus]MBY5954223.1 signal recognition particle-docking protein FtsY [Marinobacter nauticus]MBY6008555.1 signal recognition particle-docking protein FtsY [Marinobacter nauticus]
MTAEWISVGLLALLVLFFVLDIAGNRKRAPRPKPVPQRKPEVARGPAPVPAEPEAETEVPPEPAVEAAEPEAAQPAVEPAPAPEPVPAAEPEVEREPETRVSVFERIKQGLGKTRASLTGGLADLFSVGKKIDEDLLEEIETTLLMADVGVTATSEIIDALTEKLERNQLKDGEALRKALRDELHGLLKDVTRPLEIDAGKQPYVILMVGVNGVGKTTTIGKLTKKFQSEGKSVMLAAGDTFRAAAVEQLQVWGERNNVPVVAQHTGADSASVIFDAIQSAQSRGVDVVIADTAGRLQNKDNLMNELSKVVRVMKKLDESAPHEVMLVLDAGTGQNALSQAQVFQQAVGVSGITLTKLDGTAKGGIVFAIARQLQLPIRYIGVGEQAEDLRSFDAETFVDALFED